ncbi:hypothetical protein HBI56_027750 [Parastagonospora nodorum]|nr:hypothetical protein HBI10_018860 [Parastagonospora nodorum]KAH4015355.1 hypothetical protein HBI13_161770 [Parastagonospora nodorum]KAH4200650.1 hypothetical protein HBI95_172340 [Parastagonospora nodorum]KAH4342958.1 hypothetical protein HBH98_157760 [Parastagonospora nodorum]KAH4384815.1 hypothetical protein HBH97_070140 [Parastagonospora nodorum]
MNPQMRSLRTTHQPRTGSLRNSNPGTQSTIQANQNLQPPSPKLLARASTTFYARIITDWWWWELVSWFVSFSCFMAIVGILWLYDGKKQPSHVVKGITLNAFIAVFSAIARAAMILPVSESIGQLKWIWFKEERKLADFLAFDNASRGPWGSLILLGTTMCRRLVSVGAAITVLALAFEPFFQQSVSFPSRNMVTGNATLSVATSYRRIDDIVYPVHVEFQWLGINTWAASRSAALDIMNALSARNDPVRPAPSFCPTGQCTWTKYSSLGVCHRCQDVSRLLVPVCSKDQLASPAGGITKTNHCGHHMNGTFVTGTKGGEFSNYKQVIGLSTLLVGDRPSTMSGVSYYNSTVFQRTANALLNFYVAYTPDGDSGIFRNATPVMSECIFHWCVKTFQGVYREGRLEEDVLSTYSPPDLPTAPTEPRTAILGTDSNDAFVMLANGETFNIAANTTRSLSNSLRANLPTYLSNSSLDTGGQYPGRWNFVQNAPYDVNAALGSMAEALTNNMRTSATNNGTELTFGEAWGAENFVETQWPWLLLPGALLFCSLILITSTIIKSRQEAVPTWKSSALATLLHGLTEESRACVAAGASQSEVEAVSQNLKVKLLLGMACQRLTPVSVAAGVP